MVFQGAQVALALGANGEVEPALARMISDLTYALSVIAYVPMAVVLAAVAVVSLRARAFPMWLGWLTAAAAVMHLLMSFGLVVDSGPLVPGGGLTYVLYLLMAVWLAATTTVMVVRSGQPASATMIHDSQKVHPGGQFQKGEQDV